MTFEFNATNYVWTHGRQPKGYGSWAFIVRDVSPDPIWAPTSTYAQAKAWLRAHVKTLAPAGYAGHVEVKVCT